MCPAIALTVMLLASAAVLPHDVQNESFRVRSLALGPETRGTHLFSAEAENLTQTEKHLVVDIRTEGLGLGLSNYQRQCFFTLAPHERRRIECEYENFTPMLARTILRFGESPRAFDMERWSALPDAERNRTPFPKVAYFSRQELAGAPSAEGTGANYGVLLSPLEPGRIADIRRRLPEQIRESRRGDARREKLRELFKAASRPAGGYDYRAEEFEKDFAFLNSTFEAQGVRVEPFSIAGEAGIRVSAFFATSKESANARRPLVFLLTGNPPGVKEVYAGAAMWFAKRGYHAVAVDRRPSSRRLDSKQKLLTNFSDPVRDLLRLIDYFHDERRDSFSRIGLYGYSAGAMEGKFAAALDDRISAVALACGTASHNSFFEDEAWVPTYSGMIVFPELGLGKPEIGKLSREQFFENLAKLKPEHNARARQVFREQFPFFEELDPLNVLPLAAPVPVLVVTGARDDQFKASGAVEVDRAVQAAYAKYALPGCSELYIEPRAEHYVDSGGSAVVAAFFDRWLK